MNLFRSWIYLAVVSSEPDTLLEGLARLDVKLKNLEFVDELTVRFWVSPRHYRKIIPLMERYGCAVRILKITGLYSICRRGKERKLLIAGISLILLMTWLLPGRIWFFRVEGNECVSAARILEAAEQAGIRFGASRRTVRSEQVKNSLLQILPELQWVGVNTQGSMAVISVRERAKNPTPPIQSGHADLVALRDGVIISCTAEKGTLLCAEGQTVTKGQTLISGYVDGGFVIRELAAEGEVYARTIRREQAVFPSDRCLQGEVAQERRQYSLIVGKKRINLWKDSGICDATCDRIYKEYYTVLPGGLQLPLILTVDICLSREQSVVRLQPENVSRWLEEYVSGYLRSRMIAGTIHTGDVTLESGDGVLYFTGEYSCTEMIAGVQRKQIGAEYGESD